MFCLLVLFLCVVSADKCVLPPYPAHGTYIVNGMPSAAPGQAYSTVGLNVTCDPGYEMSGKTDALVICFGGIWTEEVKDCEPSADRCVLPPYPAHGTYIVNGMPSAAPGQAFSTVGLNVTCDPGYEMSGKTDALVICFGGIWTEEVKDCEFQVAKCVLPPYPAHGTYIVNGIPSAAPGQAFSTVGLNVTCDPGYEMSGKTDALVICFGGIWTEEVKDCEPSADRCVLPPYPAHGTYIVNGMPSAAPGQAYSTVGLNVTCDPGYEMSGKTDALVICFGGIWTEEVKDCELKNIPCVLPPYPAHGSYIVAGLPDAVPGQAFDTVALNITCDPGYDIEEEKQRLCFKGIWSENMTDCVALCHLAKNPSVEYRCLHKNHAVSEWQWSRECDPYEHDGIVVTPKCKKGYFFPGNLSPMRCNKGKWNYIARCIPVTSGACVLPPFPVNGSYTVTGMPNAAPGQAFVSVVLTITCQLGYDISGRKDRTCYNGIWSGGISNCVSTKYLCILPPFPSHGTYAVTGVSNPVPDQTYDSVVLKVICDDEYEPSSTIDVTCHKGLWSGRLHACLPKISNSSTALPFPPFEDPAPVQNSSSCRLEKDPSVHYRCQPSPASRATRECNLMEPIGTIVRPECNIPNYYFPGVLNHMRCFDGRWNYIARCVPECGLVTPKGTQLVIGGRPAERGELPWHAAIYKKEGDHRGQICGGSIISPKAVISAGHCFMKSGSIPQPASNYAVAVGKLYRDWDDERDNEAQKSDLSNLIMPKRFRGSLTNFQEDIALLLLKVTIVYQKHIRPICLDFNQELEREQLQDGKLGKVAGWGLTGENGNSSSYLKVVELPFVPIDECQADSPLHFREYITGDKICAGYRNGTAVCKGDSGGGLAFPRQEQEKTRYFLRGLVSTAPNNNTLCNALWLTMFTQVSRHERFIKDHTEL